MSPMLMQNASLRERVRSILLTQIMAGDLVAGRLYSVAQFSKEFEISPTPIREAVLDLAKSNIISIQKNRGFIVPEVTDSELEELHKIRMLLEIPATVESGMIMTEEDFEICEVLAKKTATALKNRNLQEYVEYDRNFHSAFLRPMGMPHLHDLILEYKDRVRLKGLRAKLGTKELTLSASEHLKMVEAARKRDSGRLKLLITGHIEATKKRWKVDS